MFSLCDLHFVLCARDPNVQRAQRIMGLFILITHRSPRSHDHVAAGVSLHIPRFLIFKNNQMSFKVRTPLKWNVLPWKSSSLCYLHSRELFLPARKRLARRPFHDDRKSQWTWTILLCIASYSLLSRAHAQNSNLHFGIVTFTIW